MYVEALNSYDLSDTHDENLGVRDIELTACDKHPLVMSRTHLSNPGPSDPLVNKFK